jgi:hypothetical protein
VLATSRADGTREARVVGVEVIKIMIRDRCVSTAAWKEVEALRREYDWRGRGSPLLVGTVVCMVQM